jgi:hypothetical protein
MIPDIEIVYPSSAVDAFGQPDWLARVSAACTPTQLRAIGQEIAAASAGSDSLRAAYKARLAALTNGTAPLSAIQAEPRPTPHLTPIVAPSPVSGDSSGIQQIVAPREEAVGRMGLSSLTSKTEGVNVTLSALRQSADLAWNPEIVALKSADGIDVDPDIARIVRRSDNKRSLGAVGANYKTISNDLIFDMGSAIVGASHGDIAWGNAGHLRGGAQVFLQLKRRHKGPAALGDAAEREDVASLTSAHDGSLVYAFGVGQFVVIVCANTFRAAHSLAATRLRHTATGAEMAATALRAAQSLEAAALETDQRILSLLSKPFGDKDMLALSMALIPGEATRSENTRQTLMRAWYSAPGAAPGTQWGAAQAVTYYTSHEIGVRGTEDNRAANLALGVGAGPKVQESMWYHLDTEEGQEKLQVIRRAL